MAGNAEATAPGCTQQLLSPDRLLIILQADSAKCGSAWRVAAAAVGQQQRVLLARALYREPVVLFLDEGTANLDPATEHRVAETLRGLACTRVFIAHREAAVAGAGRVFVVDRNTVTEIAGTRGQSRP